MKRIIVSVTNDLVTDQRVYKVCKTLYTNDYDIVLIGRLLDDSPALKRPYRTIRMRLIFNKGFLFYAEYNLRLFLTLLFLKKDVLLANDLDSLWANYLVSRVQGTKLVYDSHELFTEVPELIDRPRVQKFWLALEQQIVPRLKNNYTVCASIANYYKEKYKSPFTVIRNLPELQRHGNMDLPFPIDGKKLILYQGALNKGRGLELMVNTMRYLDHHIFAIVGTGDIEAKLKAIVQEQHLSDKVKFLGRIEPSILKSITPNADLGISIEEDLGLNYRFALPNKLFDYIHAGVPVLVSDLPEMKNILDKYNVGAVISNRNPVALAEQIEDLLKLEKTQWKIPLGNATEQLNWNLEKDKLLKLIARVG